MGLAFDIDAKQTSDVCSTPQSERYLRTVKCKSVTPKVHRRIEDGRKQGLPWINTVQMISALIYNSARQETCLPRSFEQPMHYLFKWRAIPSSMSPGVAPCLAG